MDSGGVLEAGYSKARGSSRGTPSLEAIVEAASASTRAPAGSPRASRARVAPTPQHGLERRIMRLACSDDPLLQQRHRLPRIIFEPQHEWTAEEQCVR